MRINLQEANSASSLNFDKYDIGICGKVVDERGNASLEYVKGITNRTFTLEYNEKELEISLDTKKYNAETLVEIISKFKGGRFILEATTLGFAEIYLCCKAFVDIGFSEISILYVEPHRYSNLPWSNIRLRKSQLLTKRYFALSNEVSGYRAIPGATYLLHDLQIQRVVFFLGYEKRRLERALEDFQMIKPEYCTVVFGVPAFKPGWEMNAFANNIPTIRDKNIRGGIRFCSARNPANTVDLLEEIYSSLRNNERMFIAPIGTKPNGIGSALFAAEHQDVGILYDHPKRKENRTEQVSRWHLFKVEFNKN